MSRRPLWLEVLAVSLRLGLASFGGPIAHVGYQRTAFVVRLQWLDEAAFAELVALCQALPGPASTQLMIAVGRLRAGWAGALAAFVGFTLPSAVLMTLLGLAAAGATIPTEGAMAGAVAGLKAAAVAVVAQAVVAMARRLTPDAPRIALAVCAGVVALAVPVAVVQPLLIVAGALIGWLVLRRLGTVDPTAPAVVPIIGVHPGSRRRTFGSRGGTGPPWPWRWRGSPCWSAVKLRPGSPASPSSGSSPPSYGRARSCSGAGTWCCRYSMPGS